MSDNFYLKLRKEIKERERKGAIPFPTYAEASFSQVLVSRKVVSSTFEKPVRRVPVVAQGPEVASSAPEAPAKVEKVSEKKELLQSLDHFIEEKLEGKPNKTFSFKGGEAVKKDIGLGSVIDYNVLGEGDRPVIYDLDAFDASELKILFLGERPKDFNDEAPYSDLLSKMISAMTLQKGEYCRVYLTKDPEAAHVEWRQLLKMLDGRQELTIVSLGAMATNTILGRKERLSKVHGQEFNYTLQAPKGDVKLTVFPVFHPDILLINPNMKRSAWIDLQKVMGYLGLS